MSVAVEASVQDAKGQFIPRAPGLGVSASSRTATQQALDTVTSEATPATFALLVDSSQSMSRNIGFVQNAAGKLTKYLRDIDYGRPRAVPQRHHHDHRARRAIRRRSSMPSRRSSRSGRHRDSRRAAGCVRTIRRRRRPPRGRADHRRLRRAQPGQCRTTCSRSSRHSRVTVYVISIGGVAGVSLRGERLLRRIASGDRRPGVLPLERTAALRGTRHDHRRRAASVPADLHADEPGAGRLMAGHHRRHGAPPSIGCARRPGYRAPTAGPGAHVGGIHRHRRPPAARRSDRRGSRSVRGRRAAEARDVQRVDRAGVDHAGSRQQWQHDALRRDGAQRRAWRSSSRCATRIRSA